MKEKKITIVCTGRMGHGTFEAKFNPIVRLDIVKKVIVVRKDAGPNIPKISYKVLPYICKKQLINVLVTPFILYNEVKKHKADVILAYHYLPHFYFAYLVSLLTRVPYVIGQTGTDVQLLSSKPVQGLFLRHIVRRALSFNVPGKDTYTFWLTQGVPKERLRILHSTIDTEVFIPTNNEKEFDFIFVGRLTEVKRLDKLILAVARLKPDYPEMKICIVGSGHLQKELMAMADAHNVGAMFNFAGLHSNIHAWLLKSHAFVMTSDSEGLPCAMMEAMSTGLICIGPLVNNMADLIIEGKTGFGFQTNDIDQLTFVMRNVMETRSTLGEIRESARELIINEHSYQVAQQDWSVVFNQLQ